MKKNDSGSRIRLYLAIGLIIQIVSGVIFIASYVKLRDVTRNNIMQFTDAYMNQVQMDFSENRLYIENELLSDPETRNLFRKHGIAYVNAIGELQTRFRIAAQTNDNRYHFYTCDRNSGLFIELSRVTLPFFVYRKIRPALKSVVRQGVRNGQWTLCDAEGVRFVQASWTYGDFVLGVWCYEEDLLDYVSNLDYGKNGGASLVLKNDVNRKENSFFSRTLTYRFTFPGADTNFDARFLINQTISSRNLFWLEITEFILTLFVFAVLYFMAHRVRKRLIEPLQNLSLILEKYRSNPELPGDSVDREELLGDTYDVLNGLLVELDEQRTELYQSELEKRQLQLNFRNAQIRPHFLVNCLAMLSGMASVGEAERVQEMTVYLSRYIRYILQDCMDTATIEREVEHMRDIIEICRGLNSHDIRFDVSVDEEASGIRLPVLVISTFIENSIRHYTGEEDLEIRLFVSLDKESDTLSIRIADNGEGFSEDALYMLNVMGEMDEENGRHIGINNVLQRLELFYGDRAEAVFENVDGHAVVSLAIKEIHHETPGS